jgi:predicted membrane metal-binding protein
MVFIYTLTLSVASIMLIHLDQTAYISLATILFTSIYYMRIYMDERDKFINKIKNGEFFHQLAFLAWLYFFSQQDFMFFVPLILSNVGKIYSIFHGKDEDNQSTIEELIKFQTKL